MTTSSATRRSDTEVLASLLSGRHSCRAFRADPVPDDTVRRMLDLARRAPSWCNTQPWHVHITSGSGTSAFRDALAHSAREYREEPDLPFPPSYDGVYRERRRESGWRLYDSVGIARGDRAASARQSFQNFELFGAPHAAVLTTDSTLGTYGAVDCGLFLQTFLLAAQSLGVAAIPQAAIASQAPAVRAFLGLTPDRLVLCGVSFGYADLDHPANGYRTHRADVDEIATFVTDAPGS